MREGGEEFFDQPLLTEKREEETKEREKRNVKVLFNAILYLARPRN